MSTQSVPIAQFRAVAGVLAGASFEVRGETIIGRDSLCTIVLEDASVSRRHCALHVSAPASVLVEDLGSANQTWVNGIPVKRRSLEEGDEIAIGKTVFRLERTQAELDLSYTWDTAPIDLPQTLVHQPRNTPQSIALKELVDFGCDIAGLTTRRAVCQRLGHAALALTPADRAAVILLNAEYGSTKAPADLDVILTARQSGEIHAISQTVLTRVLADRAAFLSNDLASAPASSRSILLSGVHGILAAPIFSERALYGVLYLDTISNSQFEQHHSEQIAALGGIAAAAFAGLERYTALAVENSRLRSEAQLETALVGRSPKIRALYDLISRVAVTTSTVLIRGESGTGKELVARAIQRNSLRHNRPFVAINCAALTESLLESELFGHERGAFTGAIALRKGKLEEADGGTLFLDEVGEMSLAMQAKVLRFLQEREFQRVGSNRVLSCDVRLLAATNRPLERDIAAGTFRADLFYRLNVINIDLPALRDRRDDVPLLAAHFLSKHALKIARRVESISPAALDLLAAYDWPGNVRELENVIERALVLGSTPSILPDDLPESLHQAAAVSTVATANFHSLVLKAKRDIVTDALASAGDDPVAAARRLGIHPNNLYRLIRTLQITRHADSESDFQ